MSDLTISAANCHNETEAVAALPALRADVYLLCEVNHRGRELAAMRRFRYLTGVIPGPSREVGILVSRRIKRLTLRGHYYQFVSAVVPRFKRVGKERWGQVALVQVGRRRIACVALHPVAAPRQLAGDDPTPVLVRRYAAAMRWLEQTVAQHRSLGHEVVVGADINMRESWDRPWSPHAIFAEHDMETLWDGLDVIAWTPGLKLGGTAGSRVRRDFPSDHPALRVELNLTRNRRR